MEPVYGRAALICVGLLTILAGLAHGQNSSFPVTGGAFLETAIVQHSSARSTGKADFSYAGVIEDAPDGLGFCYPGQVCDGSKIDGGLPVPISDPPITKSKGCLHGVCGAKGFGGGVSGIMTATYDFSFITPSNKNETVDFKVPVTVSGYVYGIGVNNVLWTVTISGSGTAELIGYINPSQLAINEIKLSYTGTGTVQ